MEQPIKLLIADDSPVFVDALIMALEIDRGIQIVGVAEDGAKSVKMAAQLRPDIITMDIHMPGLNGLVAIEQIMSSHPIPILVLTSDPNSRDQLFCFEALSRGALELMEKPPLIDAKPKERQQLCDRIRLLASIPLVYHINRRSLVPRLTSMIPASRNGVSGVLAIAASTGGPSTILEIIRALPANFPLGILVVQHLAPGFAPHFAAWLQQRCGLQILVARNEMLIEPGKVFIAPSDRHMLVGSDGRIVLECKTKYNSVFCPSADALFKSVAKRFKHRGIGVVLTGMGRDGAQGLLELRRAGGITVAQDAATCVVDGMPKAARNLNAAVHIAALPHLAALLLAEAEAVVKGSNGKGVD